MRAGSRLHEPARQLLPYALRHQRVGLAARAPSTRMSFDRLGRDGEAEARGEARHAQDAHRVLGEGLAHVAQQCRPPGRARRRGVDELAVVAARHRVDGEVAALAGPPRASRPVPRGRRSPCSPGRSCARCARARIRRGSADAGIRGSPRPRAGIPVAASLPDRPPRRRSRGPAPAGPAARRAPSRRRGRSSSASPGSPSRVVAEARVAAARRWRRPGRPGPRPRAAPARSRSSPGKAACRRCPRSSSAGCRA